jgi:pantoate--beta-alanine ligase
VTTVVARLLSLVGPDRAYFGQKDAQQLIVVRRMVRDLGLPVEVIGLPIVREPDGLAMSSRNVYLSSEERSAAHVLCLAVSLAARMFDDAERDATRIRDAMRALIAGEPLAEIDYISVADAETLEEVDVLERTALVSLAVRFGRTRLLDNTLLRLE